MHQTTIRFTPRVWSDLEAEARRQGVSGAQYVRDATVARLAYDATEPSRRASMAPDDRTKLGEALQLATDHRAEATLHTLRAAGART